MPRPRKRYSKFIQGEYRPINRAKCTSKCVYRSSFELKLFEWLDRCPGIIRWCSECMIVPYMHPFRHNTRRYYPDCYAEIVKDGVVKKYLIELKPHAQTLEPVPSKRKKRTTVIYEKAQWMVNQAKWKAAREYCQQRGIIFMLMTEKELNLFNEAKETTSAKNPP